MKTKPQEKGGMFILVFRPHTRKAWAEAFSSEGQFVTCWLNGYFNLSCFASQYEGETRPTYVEAINAVGHDLYCLTRLDSAEEVRRYIHEPGYAGPHNKGYTAAAQCARDIGWNPANADD